MSRNKIKREDIITDDALNFAKEYADNVKEAISANKHFTETLLEILEVSNKIKKDKNSNSNIMLHNENRQMTPVEMAVSKIRISKSKASNSIDGPNIHTTLNYSNEAICPLVNIQIEGVDLSNKEEVHKVINKLIDLAEFVNALNK